MLDPIPIVYSQREMRTPITGWTKIDARRLLLFKQQGMRHAAPQKLPADTPLDGN
jgi:hypothetical protein